MHNYAKPSIVVFRRMLLLLLLIQCKISLYLGPGADGAVFRDTLLNNLKSHAEIEIYGRFAPLQFAPGRFAPSK